MTLPSMEGEEGDCKPVKDSRVTKPVADEVVLLIDKPSDVSNKKKTVENTEAENLITARDSQYSHGSCSFSKDSVASFHIHCDDQPKPKVDNHKEKAKSSPETKPTNPPNRVLSRSVFSKPKSRFVEPSYPSSAEETLNAPLIQQKQEYISSPYRGSTPRESTIRARISSPFRSSPKGGVKGTPKSTTPSVIDEEEEETYKDEDLPGKKPWQKKPSIRVLVEWTAFILITGCLICSLTVNPLKDRTIWGLEIWKWCLMVLVIFCGRLVSGWFITLLVLLIEQNFMLRKKVLYFVYGLRKSVQKCLWLGLILLAWSLLFDDKVERTTKSHKILSHVSRALVAFLIAAALWLVKTLLVKVLASSFHVNTFFDRIQESIFHQYVLEALSGPPVMELQETLSKGGDGARSAGKLSFRTGAQGKKVKVEDGVIDVDKLHKMEQDKVSAWTMKRMVNVIRSSGLSTISNALDESVDEEEQREINSEWEAKAAAYRIFRNAAKPGSKYIEEEDLLRFLRKNEVDSIFPQFEGAIETGKIKKSALRNWVVKVYLDRKALAHSLNDTNTAVNQLHKLASATAIIIIIIVCLLFMGFATTKVLFFISSQLLLVVFIFGNTCKTMFESIIFVFVMHPFDVGDRCVIDGVQMIVEEMNILTTIFLRYDNEKIYYPNAVLLTKPISNFYRSPEMGDNVEFCVDVSTSMESIGALKARIQSYLESKPQHWQPKHSVVVKDIENLNKMKMGLYVTHTINHQNYAEKTSRRSDLVLELKKIFAELGIRYRLLPQEVEITSMTGRIPF
ncbi:mechanosensitive ion channel protein 10 [Amborella trichopoda]|nr:mechanosensitive ion channel protein 10 [Amborella trichopoda]|eukprot:XP_006849626.2 mechanosensitive ion channel protein 10 [Amborella trichopoda]